MSKQVVAQMAGTIWKILVKEGDTVNAGDTVAILESMKMEIPLEATQTGVVAKIDAPEGTVVDDGATVVTIA
jgi:acetyl-CoA carboxylase biotin carboxyl carrier protein